MRRLCRRGLIVVALAFPVALPLGCWGKAPQAGPAPGPRVSGESGQAGARTQLAGPVVGKAAPGFTLTTVDGKKTSLSSLKGKPVVLVFWRVSCPVCAKEAPELQALYKRYGPKGLQMLGIGVDEPKPLAARAKELGLTYPIASGPEVIVDYNVNLVPHVVVISRRGLVSASLMGGQSKERLEAEIKKVL